MSIIPLIQEITEVINNTEFVITISTQDSYLHTSLNKKIDLESLSSPAKHIWRNYQYHLTNHFLNASINYEKDRIDSSLPESILNVAQEILRCIQYDVCNRFRYVQKKKKRGDQQYIESAAWLNKPLYYTSNPEELDTLYAIYKNMDSLNAPVLTNIINLAFQKYGRK
jgi:hypothetical protein